MSDLLQRACRRYRKDLAWGYTCKNKWREDGLEFRIYKKWQRRAARRNLKQELGDFTREADIERVDVMPLLKKAKGGPTPSV